MVDVFGIVSLLLTYSTCFYEELWHYDGSINCQPFSDLVQSRRLCETKKDPSCCHLFRTWKRLKLCTNNLIALKMITSDQMSVDLINGLILPSQRFDFTACCLPSLCHMLRSMLLLFNFRDGLHSCFFRPTQTYRPGCTCGQVSMVVTMVSIIRAPGWCNDKVGAWLSLISSIFYLLSSSS